MQYLRCCPFVLSAAADVESDGANEMKLPDADSASWAREESVGSDAIIAFHLGELVGETEMENTQSKTDAGTMGLKIHSVLCG
jgi:hypothetical protein